MSETEETVYKQQVRVVIRRSLYRNVESLPLHPCIRLTANSQLGFALRVTQICTLGLSLEKRVAVNGGVNSQGGRGKIFRVPPSRL